MDLKMTFLLNMVDIPASYVCLLEDILISIDFLNWCWSYDEFPSPRWGATFSGESQWKCKQNPTFRMRVVKGHLQIDPEPFVKKLGGTVDGSEIRLTTWGNGSFSHYL